MLDLFIHIEAMTPAEYRNGGENLHIDYGFADTSFGQVLIDNMEKGTCHIHFSTADTAINSLQKSFPKVSIKQQRNDWQQRVAQCFQSVSIGNEKISP